MASGPFDKTEPRVAATKTDRSDGKMKVCDQTFQAILDCVERERVPREWGLGSLGGWMKEGGPLLLSD